MPGPGCLKNPSVLLKRSWLGPKRDLEAFGERATCQNTKVGILEMGLAENLGLREGLDSRYVEVYCAQECSSGGGSCLKAGGGGGCRGTFGGACLLCLDPARNEGEVFNGRW